MGQPRHRDDVDLNHLLESCPVRLVEALSLPQAGVVDQDVDRIDLCRNAVEQATDRGRIAQVTRVEIQTELWVSLLQSVAQRL